MNTNTNYIARLINKLLRGHETIAEREAIEHWRKSDKRNDDLIESFQDAKNIEGDLTFFGDLDEDVAWRNIQRTPKRIKKNYIPLFGAAAVILILMATSLFYILHEEGIVSDQASSARLVKTDISPAESGALLVLADGSIMPLEKSRKTVDPKFVADNIARMDVPAEDVLLQFNTLVVPKGNFYKLSLEDGTLVWVNANSQLKFPVKFPDKERRVVLEGEAYFEVSHDAKRPFFVESKGNEVKVLGTHFNINAYSNNVRTTLSSGRVQVSNSGDVIILEPGEYANLIAGQLHKGTADLEHDLSWHNNQFYFKKETIVEIASTLSKWYDIQVKFKQDVALNKVYTGNFKRDVKLSQVLEMLTYVCDLKFELRGKELIIENK
ncbi:FecR family protein [Sphingobacterium sp. 2149]|uniref:FecR family protein n=1 Tax=Sphingobacterium sp. 2149 TaxID=2817763 RepID=UPI001AE3E667|nr:FecR domain-containing protein [Sphingobacterium sp. 2149]MDR6737148.1 ferric-dicitrate binding protein FerR (iron transport regulator) [Sphingobacterium sp. 2149]